MLFKGGGIRNVSRGTAMQMPEVGGLGRNPRQSGITNLARRVVGTKLVLPGCFSIWLEMDLGWREGCQRRIRVCTQRLSLRTHRVADSKRVG